MITDEQHEFIEQLTKTGQIGQVYSKLVAYAARRLPRLAGVRDRDAPGEVANEAFERLLSDDYAAWIPDDLSVEALVQYLESRADDIVKNHWRSRQGNRVTDRFDTRLHEKPEDDLMESAVYTDRLQEEWLSRATERDEKIGEIVLEWIGDNTTVDGQAEALGIDKREAYRLRTLARNILSKLISKQEITR